MNKPLIKIDARGIRVTSDSSPLPPHPPRGWRASWVWLNKATYPEHQTCRVTVFCPNTHPYAQALFRKTFTLAAIPKTALAWISGDTHYRCYINGKIIARGPAEVGGDYGNTASPNWWFFDPVDLRPFLRKGLNVIAAEVVLGPVVQADYSMGQGGFLFEAAFTNATGKTSSVKSDRSWKGLLSPSAESPVITNGHKEPLGWTSARFDDSSWSPVSVLGAAEKSHWTLLPREIPPLLETPIRPSAIQVPSVDYKKRILSPSGFLTGKTPSRVQPGAPLVFWLCFKQELTGFLRFDVKGPVGARMDIQFQENLGTAGPCESFLLPAQRWQHETLILRGFEFLQVTVSFPGGSQCEQPLDIFDLQAVFTSFPVRYAGALQCSEPLLNRIWQVGRWTTQLCMQAYHLDSPIHQEGLGCTGDYLIESLISAYCFGETRLARKDLLRTAYLLDQKKSCMFHTSYSLLWIWMAKSYWMHSGDLDLIREIQPTLCRLLAHFKGFIGPTGLITEAPNYMFVDWVSVQGYTLHHPPASIGQGAMNAFYYQALRDAVALCEGLGDSSAASQYRAEAVELRNAFHRHLWDSRKKYYRDGLPGITKIKPNAWMPADPTTATFTAHTNALAVAVDLAPRAIQADLMHRIMQDDSLPDIQPYFMHFVFQAMVQAGVYETYAPAALRRWQTLLNEHPSSLKECWDFGDYSHAWGATPTYQLMAHILGVTPLKPGFTEISLSPRLGDLKWIKGTVPSPLGSIQVSWHKTPQGVLKGRVSLPTGMNAVLHPDFENQGNRCVIIQRNSR